MLRARAEHHWNVWIGDDLVIEIRGEPGAFVVRSAGKVLGRAETIRDAMGIVADRLMTPCESAMKIETRPSQARAKTHKRGGT